MEVDAAKPSEAATSAPMETDAPQSTVADFVGAETGESLSCLHQMTLGQLPLIAMTHALAFAMVLLRGSMD